MLLLSLQKMTRTNSHIFSLITGTISLLILIILSLVFYRERIYFSDPAFQLFLMINDNQIEVMTNRWPSTIFRWLPYIGLKMGWSVASISKLFSASFPLFHLFVFAAVSMIYRDRIFSWLLLLTIFLATSETFYWCSSDLLQGMITAFLGIVINKNSKSTIIKYIGSGFLLIAAVFFHPLTLFPFFYIIIDDILEQKKIRSMDWHLPLVFGIGWIIRNKYFSTWYDVAKGKDFWNNAANLNWIEIPAHITFLTEIPMHYQLVVLIFIISTLILIKRKAFLRLAFMTVSILAFLTVIHLGNPTGVASFYREASYIPLAVFVGYPFIKHICNKEQLDIKYKIFIPLILIFSLMRMLYFAPEYTDRILWMEEKMSSMSCDKSIIQLSSLDEGILKMSWGLPFETCLLSTEQNTLKTLFNTPDSKDFLKQERKDVFLGPFKILYSSDFNSSYFPFDESHYCKFLNKE